MTREAAPAAKLADRYPGKPHRGLRKQTMSVNLILGSALTALNANQAALRATSTNVANVNSTDYARREVTFGTAASSGNLYGVKIEELERVVDRFLRAETLKMSSSFEEHSIASDFQQRLQSYLGDPTGDLTLSSRLNDMLGSMTQIAADPSALSMRMDVVNDVQQLADMFSQTGRTIQNFRQEANDRIDENIARANQLITTIHELNPRIQQSQVGGGDPDALLDQRDMAVRQLSELMEITVNEQDDGQIFVATRSGFSLVASTRMELQYDAPGYVDAATQFPTITAHRVDSTSGVVSTSGSDFTHHITSGEIRGLLSMRDTVLPNYAQELGSLASGVFDAVNAVHNNSASVPAPASLTGHNTGLLAADNHNFTGTTWLGVVDPNGGLVRKIEVDFTANQLSIDGAAPVAFGGTTLGAAIGAINTALAGVGSASLSTGGQLTLSASGGNGISPLQDEAPPSDRGGRGFSQVFGLNDLVTGRQATSFNTGIAGADLARFTAGGQIDLQLTGADGQVLTSVNYTMTGTETVATVVAALNTGLSAFGTVALDAEGRLAFTPDAAYADAALDVTNDTTARGTTSVAFQDFFGVGRAAKMEQSLDLSVGAAFTADPTRLSLAQLDVDGATVVGDLVLAQDDNRGALALADLNSTTRTFEAAGYLQSVQTTLSGYTSTVLTDFSIRAQSSEALRASAETLKSELDTRVADQSGVNLDEEFANLVIYQKAYNAAARLVTTAEEMYDILLSAV
ncbi:MAG: flagellar hook-associated protein FlgK [Pseudomonadota bacterium]